MSQVGRDEAAVALAVDDPQVDPQVQLHRRGTDPHAVANGLGVVVAGLQDEFDAPVVLTRVHDLVVQGDGEAPGTAEFQGVGAPLGQGDAAGQDHVGHSVRYGEGPPVARGADLLSELRAVRRQLGGVQAGEPDGVDERGVPPRGTAAVHGERHPFGQRGPQAFLVVDGAHGGDVGTAAALEVGLDRVRSHQGDGAELTGVQRQEVPLVAQQDGAPVEGLPQGGEVALSDRCRREGGHRRCRFSGAPRFGELADPGGQPHQPHDLVVDDRFVHFSTVDGLDERSAPGAVGAGHHEVETGVGRGCGGPCGGPVADHGPVEAPFILQDASQDAAVLQDRCGFGAVVQPGAGAHDAPRSGVGQDVFERGEIGLAEGAGVDPRPVARAVRLGVVGDEVLRTGCDAPSCSPRTSAAPRTPDSNGPSERHSK